jgi:hypothetical protein
MAAVVAASAAVADVASEVHRRPAVEDEEQVQVQVHAPNGPPRVQFLCKILYTLGPFALTVAPDTCIAPSHYLPWQ